MPRPLGLTSLKILAAVRDGVTYGLEIVAHSGVPSGTVYPGLSRLEKRGLLRSRWEDHRVAEGEARPRRRYYELTTEGAQVLADGVARVSAAASSLAPGRTGGSGR